MLEKLLKIQDCNLLLSNPSIEVWFLLHYKSVTTELSSPLCVKELIKRHKSFKKGYLTDDFLEKLLDSKEKAIRRAKKIEPYENPSTTVFEFVEILDELKK